MLRTSFSQSSVSVHSSACRCQSRPQLRASTLRFPLGVHICSLCLCVFWQPPRPFRLSSLPKGKENGVMSYDRVTPSFLHWWFFFWDFCRWVFPLLSQLLGILRLGSLIPLLISLSQCLERKSVSRVADLLGIRRNKSSLFTWPTPKPQHVKCSLHVSGQSAELEQFRDVQRLCIY